MSNTPLCFDKFVISNKSLDSIINDENGRPYVACKYFSGHNIDVSISHTQNHAISIALYSVMI